MSQPTRIHPEYNPPPKKKMPVPTRKHTAGVFTWGGVWYCDLCFPYDDGRERDCGAWYHPDESDNFKSCFCTRAPGHKGRHAMCCLGPDEHPIKRWNQGDRGPMAASLDG